MFECTFGEWLHQCRKDAKLSKEALAKELDVTAQTISFWENETKQPSRSSAKAAGLFFNAPEVALVVAGYVPENFQRRFTNWVLRKYQPKLLHTHSPTPDEDSLHSMLEESSIPQSKDSTSPSALRLVLPEQVSLSLDGLLHQP